MGVFENGLFSGEEKLETGEQKSLKKLHLFLFYFLCVGNCDVLKCCRLTPHPNFPGPF